MYEVILNDDLFYVDGEIKFIIRGELIEISSLKNISIDRKKELEAIKNKKLEIPFEDYPLHHAIKINEGQGPYKVIYFADPYCGYCKKFDKEVISNSKILPYIYFCILYYLKNLLTHPNTFIVLKIKQIPGLIL